MSRKAVGEGTVTGSVALTPHGLVSGALGTVVPFFLASAISNSAAVS
jgi:hypothetical protein